MISWRFTVGAAVLPALRAVSAYDIVREYSGSTFFDRWNYYGSYDNLTLGDVNWVDQSDAVSQGLTYIDSNGHAIIKVDNTSNVVWNDKRNSVRITSQDTYDVGSLWVIDLTHLPYGCSVWPAFWTAGTQWPTNGEIDIIENINLASNNQYALHSEGGCTVSNSTSMTGDMTSTDCSQSSGCVVEETAANSFGSGFASAGGGVWATQFDSTGINIWFWGRSDVPSSISSATSTSSLDISEWGTPSASYPSSSSCEISSYFGPQNLVFDITLCGDWAGVGSFYNASCGSSGSTGLCYDDCVVGDGSNYADAYFEVDYVRAYTTGAATATATAASGSGSSASGSQATTTSGSSASTNTSSARGVASRWADLMVLVGMLVGAFMVGML